MQQVLKDGRGSGRFSMEVQEVFNGFLACIFDNEQRCKVVTIQADSTGRAFVGSTPFDDIFSAGDTVIGQYLADERRRQQMAEYYLSKWG